jgi:peptidyl-prolyl cis-trans isomerase D
MSALESTTKSKYFLMFLLSMIGLGFALSTCDNNQPTSSTKVATVNGQDIELEKFQRALQQFGLGELTQKQLKQLNFGKTIIEQLVSAELIRQWGTDIGLTPSKEEIAAEIMQLPYFLDDKKQFDRDRYKVILSSNRLTPQGFEDSISNEILMRHASASAAWIPVSTKEAKLNFILKNTGTKLSVIKIKPSQLKSLINVSNEEVKTFLNDSKNFTVLNNLYERNKQLYISPASFKVREVSGSFTNPEEKTKLMANIDVFKNSTSTKDFTVKAEKFVKLNAEKHSNIEHGWLTAENMVFSEKIKTQMITAKKNQVIGPEISDEQIVYYFVEDTQPAKNVSFEEAKQELTKIHLRDQNTKELERLVNEWQDKLKKLLASNNMTELKSLAKNPAFEFQEDVILNKTEKNLAGSVVDSSQLQKLFQAQNSEVMSFKSLADVLVVKVKNQITENDSSVSEKWAKEGEEFQQNLERQLGMAQLQQVTKVLTDNARIWKNESLY